jgi:pyruvate,water dikinase
VWFDAIGMGDLASVGGKNASLGELTQNLRKAGVAVPPGFALTTAAFRQFVAEGGIGPAMRRHIDRMHAGVASLSKVGKAIRRMMLATPLPERAIAELRAAYRQLGRTSGKRNPAVAVRSSATAEDLPGASFAGQFESFLNVSGEAGLIDACRRCFASLFTDRAIAYREARGFDHFAVGLSVGVQQMVRSDRGAAGVIFTLDSDSGFPDVVMISAAWGLGETVVQGQVEPDRYMVFKPLLDIAMARPIIARECGAKAVKLVAAKWGNTRTELVASSLSQQQRIVLTDDEILALARWAVAIERHYGCPMDIEWAKDGPRGPIFIVQARPETVHSTRDRSRFERFRLVAKAEPVLSGIAVGSAIAAGKAFVVRSTDDLAGFPEGAILVANNTDPDWVPVMKRAAGIVTDHGGSTSHAAIVSRELGVPAVVGTQYATSTLTDGAPITLSCAEGEHGHVYLGELAFERQEVDIRHLPSTRTAIMLNVADPSAALAWWQLPAKGVGLARMEFIIGNLARIHPMALVHPDRITPTERRQIRKLAKGYETPQEFFVDTLARGIARLAAPWHPHPAIVRLSDFKTNEYAGLIGGHAFEPAEENPMIGFRGAARYHDPRYREGFALECQAIRRAREDLGFANVIVMVPFCRTIAEADLVIEELAANGLRRGDNGLQLYMMCEIPANVILADKFARRFDGFSIGSNDLTQLTLGVDRDSDILSALFDERDEAVTRSIQQAITAAHAAGIKVGLCGQGPSDHPDFAAFLVREGIDSISLNPDSFLKTLPVIAQAEAESLH